MPKVLISDKMDPTAAQIFRARGVGDGDARTRGCAGIVLGRALLEGREADTTETVLSAQNNPNAVSVLREQILDTLPENPFFYPRGAASDQAAPTPAFASPSPPSPCASTVSRSLTP